MNFSGAINWARRIDTSLGRRLDGVRRILVDARTPMNYAVSAPIYRVMRDDPRVAFYFTSSEQPSRAPEIFREAGAGARVITPRQAFPMKFDAYIAADLV